MTGSELYAVLSFCNPGKWLKECMGTGKKIIAGEI